MATRVNHDIMLPQPQTVAQAMLEASLGVAAELEVLMQDHSTLPLFSLQPETREIPLTQGKIAIVDAVDYDWLMQWKWYAHKCKDEHTWYAHRQTKSDNKRTTILMHRAILGVSGNLPVDHRDGNGLNNTRQNLRAVTYQVNTINCRMRCDNTSGYRGVQLLKATGKWMARLRNKGKWHQQGGFDNPIDAARAYDELANLHFGEFAKLNFPKVEE